MANPACPCRSGRAYAACCGPFIAGEALPATAEELMRSRYSAYATSQVAYLRSTWHAATCPTDLAPDEAVKWIDLKILSTEAGQADDDTGEVEFVARYKLQGRAHRLHERSRFTRVGGRWIYVGGVVAES